MKTELDAMKNEFFICLKEMRKNLVLIVLCGVLGFLVGSALTVIRPPDIYRAAGSISKTVVTTTQIGVPIDIYGDLLKSRRVLDEVYQVVEGAVSSTADISSMLSVSVNNSKNILTVSARHQSPEIAIKVANAATEAMVKQINETYNNPGVMVLDRAGSVSLISTWSRTVLLYRASGVAIGLVLSSAYYILRALLSQKARGIVGCTLDGELELIGVVPFVTNQKAVEKSASTLVP